jgi:hypothetical protein
LLQDSSIVGSMKKQRASESQARKTRRLAGFFCATNAIDIQGLNGRADSGNQFLAKFDQSAS